MQVSCKVFEGMDVSHLHHASRAMSAGTCALQIAPHENDGVKLFESILSLPNPEQLVELFGSVEGP